MTPAQTPDLSDFKPEPVDLSDFKADSNPAGGSSGSWGPQPSIPVTVPNARIRNLPNPAEGETSPAMALYHGAKTGAQLASIPASLAASIPQAIGGLVGGAAVGKGAQLIAQASGAGPAGQEIAGDVGGLAGGALGGSMAEDALSSPANRMLAMFNKSIGGVPPRPMRPAPQWQSNPQPVQEFKLEGSTPEEIQAQLTRMANRPRTSRPEGTPAESPYQVQNIPVQGAKPPASQGTIPNLPEMQPSQSTTIAQHGYDPVKQQMTVQFKNGNVYRYSGVPQKVFDQYQSSESQGSFHANNIKGRYQTDKIGTVKPTQAQKISQALGGQQ